VEEKGERLGEQLERGIVIAECGRGMPNALASCGIPICSVHAETTALVFNLVVDVDRQVI
jgi:hypothetical protein